MSSSFRTRDFRLQPSHFVLSSALAAYALLTIVLTWPLAPGLGRDLPADFGDPLLNCRTTTIDDRNIRSPPLTEEPPSDAPPGHSTRRPLLIDIRTAQPLDADARHHYSGQTLVDRFSALALRRVIPIIAQTTDPAALRRVEALNAGCDACLSKPFKPDDLVSAIRLSMRPPSF